MSRKRRSRPYSSFRPVLCIAYWHIPYYILRIAYSPKGHPKHNIISVIFNDTVQDNISRGLAETMIMAPIRVFQENNYPK